MINRFILNEVSYFGPGAREVLPKEIARLGLHKAFVATDKDLIKFGVAEKVLSVLREASIPYEVFSEIKPNPTVSNVKAGLRAYAASGADFIIAIGVSRCATMIIVLLLPMRLIACITASSVSLSSELVASSKNRISGSR